MNEIFAAIEGGGTKWICALGTKNGEVLEEISIPTQSPEETLSDVISALRNLANKYGDFKSIGIGTFGPIVLDQAAENFGSYLETPKEGWSGVNIIEPLSEAFGEHMPICLDTDVNTAVFAEVKIGAGQEVKNCCYITVGTGIGGGVYMNGQLLKGRMHPEIGHLVVQESENEPNKNSGEIFSVCPFHSSCIEGKASGTAMQKRWGDDYDKFPQEAWLLEAEYLGQLCVSLTACYSPEIIIFGGGVSKKEGLMPMIRSEFEKLAGNYWSLPKLENYITLTQLDDRAGLIGALLLATEVQ